MSGETFHSFQFLMKKHVTNKTRQKLTHAVGTISQVKKMMEASQALSAGNGNFCLSTGNT